jgi:predicted metal-binding protein
MAFSGEMVNKVNKLPLASIQKAAAQLGIATCLELSPKILIPRQRIRDLCFENKCGNLGNHYMCPPHVGTIEEHKDRLKKYRNGILLQYSKPLDVNNDRRGIKKTKVDFHNRILQLEDFLESKGIEDVWGMIGGSCGLCDQCRARFSQPCPYPDKARMSLESIAIDVLALLDKSGLDSKFYPDRIIWTGCVLF